MNKPVKRFFSNQTIFKIIKNNFAFLIQKIKCSGYEYDLQIRDNCFNLYYKGNSIGKVSIKIESKQDNIFRISINKSFVTEEMKKRFMPKQSGDYLIFDLKSKLLHPLFSEKNLKSMSQNIKNIKSQEEINYEQMLITDNMGRNDFIIIDRQIVDSRSRLDLLALVKKSSNEYQFCAVEVKLGNNPDLDGDVLEQVNRYIKIISDNYEGYKDCYEQNLKQKQELGLIDNSISIQIVPSVIGVIVVGGYSGIAKNKIEALKKKDNHIKIIQFRNQIDVPERS